MAAEERGQKVVRGGPGAEGVKPLTRWFPGPIVLPTNIATQSRFAVRALEVT